MKKYSLPGGPDGPTLVSVHDTIFEQILHIENAAKYFLKEVNYPKKLSVRKKWPTEQYFTAVNLFLKENRSFLACGAFTTVIGVCGKKENDAMVKFRAAIIYNILFIDTYKLLESKVHTETYLLFCNPKDDTDELMSLQAVILDYEAGVKLHAQQIIVGCGEMRAILESNR
jgi:hypothetical protein